MRREEALDRIVALAAEHDLSARDIAARLPASTTGGNRLTRLLGIVGGVFVFAGLCALIGLQWEALNASARVIITLGPGVSCFILALLAIDDERRQHVSAPLLWIAALLTPTGLLVAFDEFGRGGPWQAAVLITCATLVVQYAVALARTGYLFCLFVIAFFATSFWYVLLDWIDMDWRWIALTLGTAWTLAGLHCQRSRHDRLSPMFLFFGPLAALSGWFDMVQGSLIEPSFLIAAVGLVFLGVARESRTLNVAGTLAILA
ncbi:MAG: DUF2157 domain-containing protein, partial [Pseudomonadota bacterium]